MVDEAYAYRLPDGLRRRARRRRCCAPGSSATGRCERPSCRPAVGSGSTASARRRTSSRRSRSPRAPTVHVMTRVGGRPASWRCELGAASVGPADDAPPEPLDAAILFAPGGRARAGRAARRSTAAARCAVAGIHLSDIPPLRLRATSCSRRRSCAASPRTPARTARSSCGWLRRSPCVRSSRRCRSTGPTTRSPTSPPTASPGPPSSSRSQDRKAATSPSSEPDSPCRE